MVAPSKLIFLPEAGGSPEFWRPVSRLLRLQAERCLIGWPRFGPIPANKTIRRIDDLIEMVVSELNQPAALIAQSMGGVVAIKAALRKPELVTHLILVTTSGGMNISELGAEDWWPSLLKAQPELPRWFVNYNQDLTGEHDLANRLADVVAPIIEEHLRSAT